MKLLILSYTQKIADSLYRFIENNLDFNWEIYAYSWDNFDVSDIFNYDIYFLSEYQLIDEIHFSNSGIMTGLKLMSSGKNKKVGIYYLFEKPEISNDYFFCKELDFLLTDNNMNIFFDKILYEEFIVTDKIEKEFKEYFPKKFRSHH